MNREKAEMEAERRWGERAFADWFTTEGDPPTTVFKVGYFEYLGMGSERTHWMGEGPNPEAAFADADWRERCPWRYDD